MPDPAGVVKRERKQIVAHSELGRARLPDYGGKTEVGMAQAAAKPGYRRSVDLMRFAAAFGIVWDHARAPGADIGYLALSLFLVLTAYLAVGSFERSGMRQDAGNFWLSRARRILLPWLFWCLVYRVIYEVLSDAPFQILSEPLSILYGPAIHLWFLPFVMLALITIPIIGLSVRDRAGLMVACCVLVAVSLPLGWLHAEAGLQAWLVDSTALPPPLPQWFYSLPLFLFGALLAVGQRLGLVWMPMLAAAVVSGLLMLLTGIVFLAIWKWEIAGVWPTRLATYAFGIYLLHPAFMLVAFKLFGPEVDRSFAALFTFFASWAGTWACQRLPVLRQMV
jgi:peptidoglycan/LPS O-acetylase OafA/YrhL